jgi:hypothetical protein
VQRRRKPVPESRDQELVRKYIRRQYGCVAVRELSFGGPKFDVVGFSPDSGEFHIVECKRTSRLVGVGQTFGQILAYKSMIFDSGQKFLNAFLKQLARERITDVPVFANVAQFLETGKIPTRFYVALREKACSRPDFLRLMKRDLKEVGIIRINNHAQCRNYIQIHGRKDLGLCEAARVEVPIAIPPRPALQRLLDHRASNQEVVDLAATFDSLIRKMDPRMKSVIQGNYAMVYRVRTNFAGLHPKKEFIRIRLREKKKWKGIRVSKKSQFDSLVPKLRKALRLSLSG